MPGEHMMRHLRAALFILKFVAWRLYRAARLLTTFQMSQLGQKSTLARPMSIAALSAKRTLV